MISLQVGAILAIYVVFMGLTFYWCVIADPKKNKTAKWVTQTLPSQVVHGMGNVVGTKGMVLINKAMEKTLAIIYLTVVVGCYVLLVTFAYPKARLSEHVSNYHLFNGHIISLMAIATWFVTMNASPGLISNDTLHFYDHFPYDDLMYVQGRHDDLKGIPRIARSKFDRIKYREHVPRFDHYCGWVASTIGEENYRLFLFFVFTQYALCVYATTILTLFFLGDIQDHQLWEVTLFDRVTGKEFQATRWIVLQFLMDRHMYEMGVFAIVGVMSLLLTYFLGYHIYITSKGMTTNEHYKWGEIRKWHESRVRRYERYQQQQKERGLDSNDQQSTATASTTAVNPPIPDGDVGCTGGNATDATTTKESDPEKEEGLIDPGPLPKNMYDQGFVENWKQVLFPISLRKKREAAMGGGATDKRKDT